MVNEFVGVLPASYPRIFFFFFGGGGLVEGTPAKHAIGFLVIYISQNIKLHSIK